MANKTKKGLSVLHQVSSKLFNLCWGGGSKCIVNQIRANTLNLPIDVVDISESTVLGAAMLYSQA